MNFARSAALAEVCGLGEPAYNYFLQDILGANKIVAQYTGYCHYLANKLFRDKLIQRGVCRAEANEFILPIFFIELLIAIVLADSY